LQTRKNSTVQQKSPLFVIVTDNQAFFRIGKIKADVFLLVNGGIVHERYVFDTRSGILAAEDIFVASPVMIFSGC